MESAESIHLTDANVFPDETVLEKVLGDAYNAFRALMKLVETHGMTHEWRFYRDGKAWLCKVQKKKRTIVWMSAWKGYMKATVYLPERFTEALYGLDISDETRRRIMDSGNVGQSKACTFEIKKKKDLKDLETVMKFKIENK